MSFRISPIFKGTCCVVEDCELQLYPFESVKKCFRFCYNYCLGFGWDIRALALTDEHTLKLVFDLWVLVVYMGRISPAHLTLDVIHHIFRVVFNSDWNDERICEGVWGKGGELVST